MVRPVPVFRVLALLLVLTLWACSGSDQPVAHAGLAAGCTINSDCASPLVCAFSRCHTGCETSRDCSNGERCMASDRPFHVCQLPEETKCDYNSQCPSGQICGVDGECRDQCASNRDCVVPQLCVSGTCAETTELDGGQLSHVDSGDAGPAGQPCQYNSQCAAGLVCRSGLCIAECLQDIDCDNGRLCVQSRCVATGIGTDAGTTRDAGGQPDGSTPSFCSNGLKDGDETDTDCGGGQCPPCPAGNGCSTGGDCASGSCSASACQAATCSDQLKNGSETDIDCGGADCAPCPNSGLCKSSSDCQSGLCIGGRCHALDCTDGRVDNVETDVDCGGGTCPACDNHKACLIGSDCTSGLCSGNVCQGTGCADGTTNGTETDVDCGGASCAPCPASAGCSLAADCATGVCTNQVCQAPTCGDAALNGSETDVDCGGGGCVKCADGKLCAHGSDCQSGTCVSGTCRPSFALKVTLAGGGVGTVSSLPSGIDCGSTCSASYPAGTGVSLTATAGLNSVFGGWSGGGCSGTGPCIATMSAAQNVTATFAPSATGALNWVKTFTSASTSNGTAVALDAAGNSLNVGNFNGVVDLGGGPLTASSNSDAYLAKYSPSGTYLWARHLSGGFGGTINSVVAAANGDVVIVGTWSAAVSLGDASATDCVPSTTYNQGFIAKYSAASGAFLWARCQGVTGTSTSATGIAVAANGDVIEVGAFSGTVDFGGKTLATTGNDDIFIARYAGGDASLISAVKIGGSGSESPSSVAIDPAGNILLAGGVSGSTTLGGPTAQTPSGSYDGFVAKYSSTGGYLWGKIIGDTGNDRIYSVASDAQGNVGYAGYFVGQIDAGGGPLTAISGDDMLVGKYAPDGSYQWAKRFGGSGDDVADSVALLAGGDLVFTGYARSSLNFGGGPVAAPGVSDIFVAKLASADGAYIWSNGYGSPQADGSNALAVGATGSVLVTGNVSGPVDYGTGTPQPFTGTYNGFLLKLTP